MLWTIESNLVNHNSTETMEINLIKQEDYFRNTKQQIQTN